MGTAYDYAWSPRPVVCSMMTRTSLLTLRGRRPGAPAVGMGLGARAVSVLQGDEAWQAQ